MTERQKRFADEYLQDLNATRAYRAAYPAVKKDDTARAAGSRLLANVNVRAYIDEKLAEIQSKKIADAQEILEYLTSVIRGKSMAEIVVTEGLGEGISEARRMEKAPDEKEKLKAAEILAKYHNLLTPKIEASNQGGGVILMTPVMPDG